MGTSYEIYKRMNPATGALFTLEVNEHSNRMDLDCVMNRSVEGIEDFRCIDLAPGITPKEMMEIFLEGIKVCSYWMDKEEFQETLEKLEDYSF